MVLRHRFDEDGLIAGRNLYLTALLHRETAYETVRFYSDKVK